MPDVLHLVRHAKAGDRWAWNDDDRRRPLTDDGRRQAVALAERLYPVSGGLLVSSPYLRCVQTLEPLAGLRGDDVQSDERLAEGTGFVGALDLLCTAPAGSVLCSHGDVIPDTMAALERRGCTLVGTPDWRKASTWQLHRADDGSIVRAECWPPPTI